MNMQGPIEVEIKAHVTNGAGTDGVVTIGLGHGHYPSVEQMRQAVAQAAQESLPEGFRLMNKGEWFNSIMPRSYDDDGDGGRTRVRYAAPGGEDWDAIEPPAPDFPERLIEMVRNGDLEAILFKAGEAEDLRLELYRYRQELKPA